jgi:hypothetical protein
MTARTLDARSIALASAVGLIGVAVLGISAPPAAAQELAAATCGPPRTASITAASGGSERFAQTFSPSFSGNLTRAEIDVTKATTAEGGTPGNYIVQVMGVDDTGAPDNNALATTTVLDATVPEGQSIINAVFDAPATVAASPTP